jgi:cell division protein FtsI (penicillin-binding protein 3)
MGQEISVTTLQLAQAASVIANGGLLVKPRLLLKKGGETVPAPPGVRVIDAETAVVMRRIMEGVVLPGGTGTLAHLKGYTAGGKTGSAQIFDTVAHRYTHTYNASFMGFAPISNPAVVVVVTLNGTRGTSGFGGQAAAPVFQAVATEALRVLEVPKDLPDEPPPTVAKNDASMRDLADVDEDSVEPNILEEGEEEPESLPGTTVVRLAAGSAKVPNFKGMTMDAVLTAAAAEGLTVLPAGSGLARMQSPPPGTVIRRGERIRVEFSK